MITQKKRLYLLFQIISMILIVFVLIGCGTSPSSEDLIAVDYAPLPASDWNISTPVEQGLDPNLVAEYITTLQNWRPFMGCW